MPYCSRDPKRDHNFDNRPKIRFVVSGIMSIPVCGLLGGSWDLVTKVISTLSGAISNCKYSYLSYNPSY